MTYFEVKGYLSNSKLKRIHDLAQGREVVYNQASFARGHEIEAQIEAGEVNEWTEAYYRRSIFHKLAGNGSVWQKELYKSIPSVLKVGLIKKPCMVKVKGKLDRCNKSLSFIEDLKTTKATSHAAMIAAVNHFNYDLQGYIYTELLPANFFVFTLLSTVKAGVCHSVIMQRGDARWQHGKALFERYLSEYWLTAEHTPEIRF
jgi:hypothetical protein